MDFRCWTDIGLIKLLLQSLPSFPTRAVVVGPMSPMYIFSPSSTCANSESTTLQIDASYDYLSKLPYVWVLQLAALTLKNILRYNENTYCDYVDSYQQSRFDYDLISD